MAGNAIRDSHAGAFACSRRGGMTAYECSKADELKALGRGVQFIATFLGRPMEDVARYLSPATAVSVVAPPPAPEPASRPRWSAEEKHHLAIMVEAGLKPGQIASILNRSVGAVHQQTHHARASAA